MKDAAIIALLVLLVMKFVRNNRTAYDFVNAPWQPPAQ